VPIDWLAQLHYFGLLLLSTFLGGAIGLERELRGKPAGLRTHMFIALAATLFMLLGRALVTQTGEGSGDAIAADPTRIMHAVVVGISFIGAGTIIRPGDSTRVAGLTTAASIWLVAAIGIGVAVGQWVLAAGVTVLALAVLIGLRRIEKRVGRRFDRPRDHDSEE
jgi:putative Mg2+ transporter-C (MgtC) family protein